MKKYLVLGCNGNAEPDGFLHCSITSNSILDLSDLNMLEKAEVVDFINNGCNLDGRIEYDYNTCVNIITMLYRDYQCFDSALLHKIQFYIRMHRSCGIYLMIKNKE